jgi:predicted lipoprotein
MSGQPVTRGRRAVAAMFLAASLTSCGPGFDRGAMLGQIVDAVILPGNAALTAAAGSLDAAARAFAASPSQETLAAVRSEWYATEIAWKRVEMYQFPGMLLIHNAIETRPARVPFIEGLVDSASDSTAAAPLDPARIESLGSTSKGLGAIEYLIFESPQHESPILEAFQEPARGELLVALTGNLAAKTAELQRFWTSEGQNYGQAFRENDSEGADIQSSISLLANRLIEMYEMVMQRKFGVPMGRTTDGVPDPESVESPLTGRSLDLLVANLESVLRTFDTGLDDYVAYIQDAPPEESLAADIHAQFARVFEALGRIGAPLEVAVVEDPAAVAAAYEEMRPLLVYLKTDMAAQLGITVTFSDADGD